ncbi:MAG: amino acid adenylation domain-containing protein, partial [Actinomycetota bacterium]|nr:amino acid adenylation domain-containing protein [Actinomycetota bacterium]
GAPVVVTEERLVARLPVDGVQVVCLDRDWPVIAKLPAGSPFSLVGPEHTAYVIYTSGSTGEPKGVQIPHRALVNFLWAMRERPGLRAEDVILAVTTLSFDMAVLELYLPLVVGARAVIVPYETASDPRVLARRLASSGATVMQATPSTWRMLVESGWSGTPGLKALCGGEPMPSSLADRLLGLCDELWNMYGPTETTVWSTCARVLTRGQQLTIGRPIANTALFVLDEEMQPAANGSAGELWIGGDGLARGYHRRPDLTAERFVTHTFPDSSEARIYRTGDRARYLPTGEVEFLGRVDHQIKVRGFRIEPGEVEAVLCAHPGVAEAVVTSRSDSTGESELAAYVIPGEEGLDGHQLRQFLAGRLPPYMVPATVTQLPTFPLTANGKVDRNALPEPVRVADRVGRFRAAHTPTEELIAEIWETVLGVQDVGLAENFFALGGHSLLAARIVTEIQERTGIETSVRTLLEVPELAAFAHRLESIAPTSVDDAAGESLSPDDACPPSFQQQQLLFFDQLMPGSAAYNDGLAIRIRGELDRAHLQRALTALVERHEALRTMLLWDESPRQLVLENRPVELPLIDLCDLAEPEDELQRLLRECSLRPFDLAHDVKLRATMFRTGPAEHVVLLALHHVAFDAWSIEVLYRDLGELYQAERERRESRLPEPAAQYRRFTRWQRQRLQGERLDRERDFWRLQLAGAPTILRLRTDRRRPPMQSYEGTTQRFLIGADATEGIRNLCATENMTPYSVLLSVFATHLFLLTGQDDVLIGGPMANREHPLFHGVIGFL